MPPLAAHWPTGPDPGGSGGNTRRLDTEDHFRTDVSYLPDLTAYLDDLLCTRQRLTAALAATPGQEPGGIDRWAAADTMPSAEEITRVRALIDRITAGLDDMPAAERADVDQAVA